ncbi:MAG: chemotaxis response regulator protein-glutamate methylesterase [Nitrospirae bacterium]|nr:MAG: chemotaxis response regulator protein-glutamate methylesterase [Nitrospirota bacterium]
MKTSSTRIRVLVVDDSALMRKMIPMIISADDSIEVVGTAMDGEFALKKISELEPDVVTLDIDMPRMDGLAALKAIIRDFGTPVILVSSLTREGAETTLRGLEMGAFDFVPKPGDALSVHIADIAHELIEKIKAASRSRRPRSRGPQEVRPKPLQPVVRARPLPSETVVAIGISTGGPQALAEILPDIPADFPAGIVIVQHMPEGFTDLFSKRLDGMCAIRVKEADNGDVIGPGMALIAPGGKHLKVKRTPFGLVAVLSQAPTVSGHRPSATVLFNSVADELGSAAIGVIMTGMGDDGVEGLARIRQKGGMTIAQNEETSVIYGMPKVAIENGYADMVLGLYEIVPRLAGIVEHNGVKAGAS